MIASDFKIAIRNILRNKVQSSISIPGLGIGLRKVNGPSSLEVIYLLNWGIDALSDIDEINKIKRGEISI